MFGGVHSCFRLWLYKQPHAEIVLRCVIVDVIGLSLACVVVAFGMSVVLGVLDVR